MFVLAKFFQKVIFYMCNQHAIIKKLASDLSTSTNAISSNSINYREVICNALAVHVHCMFQSVLLSHLQNSSYTTYKRKLHT